MICSGKKCRFGDVSGKIDFDGNSLGVLVFGLPYSNPQNSGKNSFYIKICMKKKQDRHALFGLPKNQVLVIAYSI